MSDQLRRQLDKIVKSYGLDKTREALSGIERLSKFKVCTIVVNKGLHHFPEDILHGRVFYFSDSSLPMETRDVAEKWMSERLIKLKEFLHSQKWSEIYLLISGHAAACVQVKLAIYRITHIESIDIAFDGKGNYINIEIPMRRLLTGVE